MSVRRRQLARRGFTIFEAVLVMGIIGLMAAVAIPRLSRGSTGASNAALESSLVRVRSAILMYGAEHGVFPGPDATDFEQQLTQFSDYSGKVSPTHTGAFFFGPYLNAIPPIPVGPNQGSTSVMIDDVNNPPKVDPGSGDGWVYNPYTGAFVPNLDVLPDGTTQELKEGAVGIDT